MVPKSRINFEDAYGKISELNGTSSQNHSKTISQKDLLPNSRDDLYSSDYCQEIKDENRGETDFRD